MKRLVLTLFFFATAVSATFPCALMACQATDEKSTEQSPPATAANTLELRPASMEAVDGFVEMKQQSGSSIFVATAPLITQADIQDVGTRDEHGRASVTLRLSKTAGEKLAAHSRTNVGKPIAILYEGKVVQAPILNSEISRDVAISGNFSSSEIEEMIERLAPGSPTIIKPNFDFSKRRLEKFSALLEQLNEEKKFSGTVLIAQKGQLVLHKSVGFSNIEKGKRFSRNSSFRLASVSKQFTAMGIMILKEDGKLSFDDKLQKFLPELPYPEVTIRQLLHHTSGLADYMTVLGRHTQKGVPVPERETAFNKDIVAAFAKLQPEPLFAPGEKHRYSNTGYAVLGSIIEKASGQSIQDFFKQRVFEPLKMNDSRAFSVDKRFDVQEQVTGFYWQSDSGYKANDWHYLNGVVGDGGIYASADDMMKWDKALYDNRLVSAETLNEAFTPGKLNDGSEFPYGFGWVVGESAKGNRMVSHDGRWVGFGTSIIRDLDDRILVVILSNNSTSNMGPVFEGLAKLRRK